MSRELVLPWPDRSLHPNSRVHWSKRSKAAKQARADAYVLTKDAWRYLAPLPEGPIHVWINGYPADLRRRDADGLLSSLKPSLDGIADALGVDDRRFVPHPCVMTQVVAGGEVRIRITSGVV
jgi:crossover junction endodeoxyribonuclease RusA